MAERGKVGCVGDGAGESSVDSRNSFTAFGDGGGELSVIVMIRGQDGQRSLGNMKVAGIFEESEWKAGEGRGGGRVAFINASNCRWTKQYKMQIGKTWACSM